MRSIREIVVGGSTWRTTTRSCVRFRKSWTRFPDIGRCRSASFTGPPFAGKSQAGQEGAAARVILTARHDRHLALVYVAGIGHTVGPRTDVSRTLMKRKGLEAAVAEGANGWVIVAER